MSTINKFGIAENRTEVKNKKHVFLDLGITESANDTKNKKFIGKFVLELNFDVTPRTAKAFYQLCVTREEGQGYLGTFIHRVIPGVFIQGGDITKGEGNRVKRIDYSNREDENFILQHKGPGILSMANAGPNTNGTQFFITCASTPWLNEKHVVFGSLVEGLDVLKTLSGYGTHSGDIKDGRKIVIIDCGEYTKN